MEIHIIGNWIDLSWLCHKSGSRSPTGISTTLLPAQECKDTHCHKNYRETFNFYLFSPMKSYYVSAITNVLKIFKWNWSAGLKGNIKAFLPKESDSSQLFWAYEGRWWLNYLYFKYVYKNRTRLSGQTYIFTYKVFRAFQFSK